MKGFRLVIPLMEVEFGKAYKNFKIAFHFEKQDLRQDLTTFVLYNLIYEVSRVSYIALQCHRRLKLVGGDTITSQRQANNVEACTIDIIEYIKFRIAEINSIAIDVDQIQREYFDFYESAIIDRIPTRTANNSEMVVAVHEYGQLHDNFTVAHLERKLGQQIQQLTGLEEKLDDVMEQDDLERKLGEQIQQLTGLEEVLDDFME